MFSHEMVLNLVQLVGILLTTYTIKWCNVYQC